MQKLRCMMLFGILALTSLSGTVSAIELGDPAPPLKIGRWVNGKPVDIEK